MLALERLRGIRVVADAAAVEGARWTGADVTVLRFAPDEAFAIGAIGVDIDDAGAIVEDEAGFVAGAMSLEAVVPHIEWSLTTERPALAQGSIAGVPAKLWLTEDGATILVQAAYAADLQDRLR